MIYRETNDYRYIEDTITGNRVTTEMYGSIEASNQVMIEMIFGGCTGCINCPRCTDCTGCINCFDCTDCTGCINCFDCTDCFGIRK